MGSSEHKVGLRARQDASPPRAWSRRANSDDKLLSGRLWILEPANRSREGAGVRPGERTDKDGANGGNDLDCKSQVSLLSRTSSDREVITERC